MSAEKAFQCTEIETKKLLGGMERVWQINILQKAITESEVVARPGQIVAANHIVSGTCRGGGKGVAGGQLPPLILEIYVVNHQIT